MVFLLPTSWKNKCLYLFSSIGETARKKDQVENWTHINNHARNKNKNIKCSACTVRHLGCRAAPFSVLSKDQLCITMNVTLMRQKNWSEDSLQNSITCFTWHEKLSIGHAIHSPSSDSAPCKIWSYKRFQTVNYFYRWTDHVLTWTSSICFIGKNMKLYLSPSSLLFGRRRSQAYFLGKILC